MTTLTILPVPGAAEADCLAGLERLRVVARDTDDVDILADMLETIPDITRLCGPSRDPLRFGAEKRAVIDAIFSNPSLPLHRINIEAAHHLDHIQAFRSNPSRIFWYESRDPNFMRLLWKSYKHRDFMAHVFGNAAWSVELVRKLRIVAQSHLLPALVPRWARTYPLPRFPSDRHQQGHRWQMRRWSQALAQWRSSEAVKPFKRMPDEPEIDLGGWAIPGPVMLISALLSATDPPIAQVQREWRQLQAMIFDGIDLPDSLEIIRTLPERLPVFLATTKALCKQLGTKMPPHLMEGIVDPP